MASAAVESPQSLIFLGKNLCAQLLQHLWTARLLVPFGALGVGSDLKSDVQSYQQVDGAPKQKSLERFYSARDWLEKEGTETAHQAATTRNVPAEDSCLKAKELSRRKSTSEQELRRVFDTVDEDKNGKICLSELTRFMKKFHSSDCTEQQIDSLLRSADEDKNGFVEFGEFIKLYHSLYDACDNMDELSQGQAREEEAGLREAFGVFDKNKDGFICPAELQLIVQSLSKGRKRDCSQMIKAVDKDGDGKVNFEEFKQMMLSDLTQ